MIPPWVFLLPWKKILPSLAVAAAVVACWWAVDNHFDHVADLEATVKQQATDLSECKSAKADMVEAQKDENDEVLAAEAARDATEARYQELLARPPGQIVRWRERIKEVPMEIVGPTCTDALVQSLAVVQDAGGWPEDDGRPQ